jgi:uncharacterized protein (TIGR02453 family)
MQAQVDLGSVLIFTDALRQNNNREWFKAHRQEYDLARAHFENFVAALIDELGRIEPLGDIRPSDCIFRLNRDLRFTRDKTPYKPYVSAYVAPGGRRSRRMGLYVHIEPGSSMLAGGLHDPLPQELASWRAAIDRDPRPFKSIAGNSTFRKYFGQLQGERLKTIPRGYPKDHPEPDLLRLKSLTVIRHISDDDVTSANFLADTIRTFKAMKPFLRYLDSLH